MGASDKVEKIGVCFRAGECECVCETEKKGCLDGRFLFFWAIVCAPKWLHCCDRALTLHFAAGGANNSNNSRATDSQQKTD